MVTNVSFYSEGLRLAGDLYVPDNLRAGERVPGIVLCCGFTGCKDAHLPPVATRFNQAGWVALTFDYRWCGESEGEPRWQLNHMARVEDVRNAITFLQMQPMVAPERIGLYGTSFGGGTVSFAAAVDDRVRCTVSNVGVGNGERWLRSLKRHHEWLEFLRRLEEDRKRRVLTGKSEYVDFYEIMTPDPFTREHGAELRRKYPTWGYMVTLQSGEHTIAFKPEEVVHRIAPRAIMWVACATDDLTPLEESQSMYDRAGEPKRLLVLRDVAHWDVYSGKAFDETMQQIEEWYRIHL